MSHLVHVVCEHGLQGQFQLFVLNIQYALISSIFVQIYYVNIIHLNIQYGLISSFADIHCVSIFHLNMQ